MDQKKKIKVLQVAGRMDIGGIENQLMHLLRHADKSRFQIDFTTTDAHPYFEDEILSLGGRCIHIPGTNGWHLLRYCKALYRVIKAGRYDIVHSHELFHSGLVLLTARLAGVKCRFVHAHSSNQVLRKGVVRRSYTALMRWLIQHCGTEFLACSSWAGEFLYGRKNMYRSNYHVVYNSVETERFLPDETDFLTHDRHIDDWKTVLQVGRFYDEKNYSFTTRIAAECKRRGDHIRFLFVGNDGLDNPYEQEVRALIQKNHLEDYIQFLGVRKDVNELMKQADVFILPSKYEGMPLTLIEAQTACLPCIAADTFSHEVDFGVGAVQWLRLTDPVETWADAVEKATLSGKVDRNSVVSAILKNKFDVTMFADKICGYYEAACR